MIVMPDASRSPKRSGALRAIWIHLQIRSQIDRKQNQKTDKTQLLAYDSQNKVILRLRKIERLLHALAETDAGESSGSQSQERLNHLIAASLRIRKRI